MEPRPIATTKNNKQKYEMPDDQNRPEYVRKNFDEIAPTYDLYNDLITFGMHRSWKDSTVKSLGLGGKQNVHALDLCSGSGDLSLRLSTALGKGSRVTALDFSAQMLHVLQKRWEKKSQQDVSLEIREGDATDLSFLPDSSIHGVTIGFGLRNIVDREKTLGEIFRVLVPGGRLAILDVGKVNVPVVGMFHSIFFKTIVPLIGHMLQGEKHEMYDYLPASAEKYPDQKTLAGMLENTGFDSVKYKNFLFGSAALHMARRPE